MSDFTEFTGEDIALTEPIPVDWYVVEIDNFEKKLSSKGDSENYILKGHIICNEEGDTKYAGRKTPWWSFNTKLMGLSRGLWESLGVEIRPGVKVDWAALPGKRVLVFIGQQMYQDQLTNQMSNKYKKVPV